MRAWRGGGASRGGIPQAVPRLCPGAHHPSLPMLPLPPIPAPRRPLTANRKKSLVSWPFLKKFVMNFIALVRTTEQFWYLPGCSLRNARMRSLTYSAPSSRGGSGGGERARVAGGGGGMAAAAWHRRRLHGSGRGACAPKHAAKRRREGGGLQPSIHAMHRKPAGCALAPNRTLCACCLLGCGWRPPSPTCDLIPQLHGHDQLVRVGLRQADRQPAKAAADVGKLDLGRRHASGGRRLVQLGVMSSPAAAEAGWGGGRTRMAAAAMAALQAGRLAAGLRMATWRQGGGGGRRRHAPVDVVWAEGHGEVGVVEGVTVRPHAIHLLLGVLDHLLRSASGRPMRVGWSCLRAPNSYAMHAAACLLGRLGLAALLSGTFGCHCRCWRLGGAGPGRR